MKEPLDRHTSDGLPTASTYLPGFHRQMTEAGVEVRDGVSQQGMSSPADDAFEDSASTIFKHSGAQLDGPHQVSLGLLDPARPVRLHRSAKVRCSEGVVVERP